MNSEYSALFTPHFFLFLSSLHYKTQHQIILIQLHTLTYTWVIVKLSKQKKFHNFILLAL